MKQVIIKNMAQCVTCKDIVESKDRTTETCLCGTVLIDGQKEKLIRSGVPEHYIELSTVVSSKKTFNKGQEVNYNGNRVIVLNSCGKMTGS